MSHFFADEGEGGVRAVDFDVARTDANAHSAVVGSVRSHRVVDAPHVYFVPEGEKMVW